VSIGVTGGARIISFTVQLILNLLEYGLDIQQSINSPRFCPKPWRYLQEKSVDLYVEHGISESVREVLEKMGYRIREEPAYLFGASAGVLFDRSVSTFYAGADPRRNCKISGINAEKENSTLN
jgi:gamma-glutamyltranspeptidase/glutathione hydrolase